MIWKINIHPTPLTAELATNAVLHICFGIGRVLCYFLRGKIVMGGTFISLSTACQKQQHLSADPKRYCNVFFFFYQNHNSQRTDFQSAHNSIGMSIFSSLLTKGTMNLTTGKCTSLADNCHPISQTVVYSPQQKHIFSKIIA